jgi:hypothetical protein
MTLKGDGPRLEKRATSSSGSLAPMPIASGKLAGEPTVPAAGPHGCPLAKTAKMPAARRARTSSRKTVLLPSSLPHELLTMCGAIAGLPFGASMKLKRGVNPAQQSIALAVERLGGHPARARRHADPTLAHDCAHRVRAVAIDIGGIDSALACRVKPVVQVNQQPALPLQPR